ncbi:zinc-dependent alcohol dehydrogenase [Falsibacillus pallidus]|uniref:zinc-dependent alcohol dehydrogenase n=1 Tax=Falsibacillus pallidus TaxID=493781 RepID=UPI000E0B8C59|nr:zinc-binding alcohol dehydrogenase [Falsibacillus pallidus]
MKSVVARNRAVEVVEEMKPEVKPSYVLVKTSFSVISPGTEISIINKSKDHQINLGYSASGIVESCGDGVEGIKEGDLVACYGAPYVKHAEYLLVPKTLCCKVPPNVTAKEAAFGGIGAIAIHALRVGKLEFGESAVIAGLGILGQMIALIANAAAYRVFAFDLSAARTEMLTNEPYIHCHSDIEQMEKDLFENTNFRGADSVFLCAGGHKSPLTSQSLKWVRDKGKVVIVGDIEPDFPRQDMFAKEAEILISRAGGPGRYDPVYECRAIDYPYGFVRWTEGRNIGEFLRLVNEHKIDLSPYVNEVISSEDVGEAFEQLRNKETSVLTKVIRYA